jgi:ATP-dependent DNA helicase RecG
MSTGDLVEASGYSRPVVVKQLNALKDVGIVEWVGNSPKDPRAYWRLKRD